MFLTIAAAVAASAALLGAPSAPAPTVPLVPAQVDCTVYPWGYPGCEAHLGAEIRKRAPWVTPYVSDEQLGRIAVSLCRDGHINQEDLRGFGVPGTLKYQVTVLQVQAASPKACG